MKVFFVIYLNDEIYEVLPYDGVACIERFKEVSDLYPGQVKHGFMFK